MATTPTIKVNDPADTAAEEFTHYVHLANGDVTKVKMAGGIIGGLYRDADNFIHHVIGVYPKETKAAPNE